MQNHPTAFVSYSWDSAGHKAWVRQLAERLRSDGIEVILDLWHALPGDQLPSFMETAVRNNDFVLIICTATYKLKSEKRLGGVGYEGSIMTGELFNLGNERKFIPISRELNWNDASPSWLAGKYYINLSGDPYSEHAYLDLLSALHGTRQTAPPIGVIPAHKFVLSDNRVAAQSKLTVKVTRLPSPGWANLFDEYHEVLLLLELKGFTVEEIDGPQNSSIHPILEYSTGAAQIAVDLREALQPIVKKHRERIDKLQIDIRLRRRSDPELSGNTLWLSL